MSDKRKPRYLRITVVLGDRDADLREWWTTHKETRATVFREALREYITRHDASPQASTPPPRGRNSTAKAPAPARPAPAAPAVASPTPQPAAQPVATPPPPFPGNRPPDDADKVEREAVTPEEAQRRDRLRGILAANRSYT